ncbi:hypothetical protein BH10BAC5_BH10BAC5_01520 [soil metagenome]
MSKKLKINIKVFLILVISGAALFAFKTSDNNSKLGNKLSSVYSLYNGDEKILVWISFSDKGSGIEEKLHHPENYLTKESIERRKKNNPSNYFDFSDLPLNDAYVQEVVNSGAIINQKSKWFNSVSCNVTRAQLENLLVKSFITKAELVAKFYKRENDIEFKSNPVISESNSPSKDSKTLLNYGTSITQMQIINATTAHDSGFYGQGVIIASFDTGFNNLAHPCFDSIRARGLRTYDFINHDTIVADGTGRMGNGSHGTQTLSLVCGYKPGNLISPAFRSRLILAKTENTDSETPAEEDNWIAAVQWADSLGADIITSSLGYVAMDPGSSHTYDWTWMSGDSTLVTKGANLAVTKGMVVCNSAGNSGTNSTHNTLGAPSDGFKVICVGSVDSPSKQRSSFSSVGNTTRGALKPEVMALGSGNVVAQPYSGSGPFPTGYTSGSGTSFSCPMTAGVVAQLLSSNHNLTVDQVRTALFTTCDSVNSPSRFRGYGIINSMEAIKKARTLTGVTDPSTIPVEFNLSQNFPNPFNPQTTINYQLVNAGFVKINIYDITGKLQEILLNQQNSAGTFNVTWNASNFSTGIYFYTLEVNGVNVDTKKMMLVK